MKLLRRFLELVKRDNREWEQPDPAPDIPVRDSAIPPDGDERVSAIERWRDQ